MSKLTLRASVESAIRSSFRHVGFDVRRVSKTLNIPNIPDGKFYQPLFSPWLGYGEFAKYFALAEPRTLVSRDRCWILYSLCKQSLSLAGDVWECGVYKGGTAAMLAKVVGDYCTGKRVHLFDTFEGMPETDHSIDTYRKSDFNDTSLNEVRNYVQNGDLVKYHKGFIPETFKGQESSVISFAHIDVDIKQSIEDCCAFIYPRLTPGGIMVFDDYGFARCPGARLAVDQYFSGKRVVPLVLPTGQAVIFKTETIA